MIQVKIGNLVKFNDKCLFDGAVQLDWLYDKSLNEDVALSYVFHGPKYHGIIENEKNSNYSLVDSASFVEEINNKLYSKEVDKKFILAISSYGTGKSHLSVTMANLFADGYDNNLSKQIISRIKDADVEIGTNIENTIKGKNLVIAINGVKDANLNSMILNSVKKALKRDGVDESVLDDLATSINKAKEFLEVSYDINYNKYLELINKYTGCCLDKNEGKQYLLENIEGQVWVFEAINEVYSILTGGNEIRVDSSFTAGDILTILNKKLVEEKKIYNKILIIFDEFGRFIEYAASYPKAAGDSALQQIYEAVQNAKGNIIFVGFIQFDIETYISRVADNPNISKYVGRYKNADRRYLSSNLETIFANLLTKDPQLYPVYVENTINSGYKNEAEKQHRNILRWINGTNKKDVWNKYELYNKVILKGCYPFHPLSIWLLTNLSTWMQERSTINYLSQAFKKIKNDEFIEGDLNFIYPIEIITDEFIKELTGAEERGLQQSNHCTLYYNIISQMKNKLEEKDIAILKSVLIINILGIKPYDKDDLILALSYCTGFLYEEIVRIVNKLEKEDCIIIFNPAYNIYDFALETNGKSEFNKVKLLKTKRRTNSEVIDYLNKNQELRSIIRLNEAEETDFGYDFINSTEWKFNKSIEAIEDINESVISYYLGEINRSIDGDTPRGQVVFLYVNNQNEVYIENIIEIIKSKELDKKSIIFKVIRDNSRELYEAINEYITLDNFSNHEKEKFMRFYNDNIERSKKSISKFFTIANTKGTYLSKDGEKNTRNKVKEECLNKLKEVYFKAIPFKFDGFEKSTKNQAIKLYTQIISGLLSYSYKNKDVITDNPTDVANRIKGLLGPNIYNSWNALNEKGEIISPKNEKIVEIYKEIEQLLKTNKKMKIGSIFKKYLVAPYGMNVYSLEILIALFIFNYSGRLNIRLNEKILTPAEVEDSVFEKSKKGERKGLKIENFYLLELELLEENQEDIIERILDEYNKLSDISMYDEYLTKLQDTLNKISVFGEYKDKLDAIQEGLIEGQKRYNNIKKYLPNFQKYYELFIKSGQETSYEGIKNLNNLLDNYIFIRKNIEKKYKAPVNISQKLNEVSCIIKRIDNKKLKTTLEAVKCDDYRDYHEISVVFNALIKKFILLKLPELATILQNVLKDKEELLKEIEKNKEAVNKINFFIKENENIHEKTINYIIALEDKINTTLEELRSLGVSDTIKEFLIEQINNIEIGRKKELKIRESNLIEKIKLIYNVEHADDLKIELNNISKDIKLIESEEVKNKYNTLLNDFKNLDKSIILINSLERDDLDKYKSKINFETTVFFKIVMNVIKLNEEKWINEEEKWIKKVELTNNDKLLTLDIEELQKRKYQLESVPSYISNSVIEVVNERLVEINSLIKEKSIDWVVKLFDGLEDQSKEECFKRIKDKYRNIL